MKAFLALLGIPIVVMGLIASIAAFGVHIAFTDVETDCNSSGSITIHGKTYRCEPIEKGPCKRTYYSCINGCNPH